MKRNHHKRGTSYLATTIILSGISVAGMTYLNSSSKAIRDARRRTVDSQMTQLCDAGVQTCLRAYWREFKQSQTFDYLQASCSDADITAPKGVQSGDINNVGKFSAGVIAYSQPTGDSYTRYITIRSSGWIDTNGNGQLDADEPVKVVDVRAALKLVRSQVFDYTYFVNNYGWMDGFNETNLVVNGDMRANGNFALLNGTPTVNGTLIATPNEKLASNAQGVITGTPVKWNNATYNTAHAGGTADDEGRWRQGYDPAKHGARDSAQYQQWQDIIFDTEGTVQGEQIAGSVLMDSDGSTAWSRESTASNGTKSLLDSAASQEVVMPDLNDISHYQAKSAAYVDDKATFADGTPNPNYNVEAYVEVWNAASSSYERISSGGVVSGSAILIGTDSKPVKIHGPVTFTQDVVVKGTIEGQGTLYAGRNVHIVGSIRYKNKPDFRGSDPTQIDQLNEKADILGLAARGSVIMGNPNTFTSTTLQYMQPPFTKGRYDIDGNWVPAYNGTQIDATGRQRYQSVIPDDTMNAIAEGINQLDAVIYTNFIGGGNLGTSGGGIKINGSIISRDEAMVVWSLPMKMNYDSRIRERSITQKPLIDIKLPRSPVLVRSTWQERGISYGS
jgi:hypothetical protein